MAFKSNIMNGLFDVPDTYKKAFCREKRLMLREQLWLEKHGRMKYWFSVMDMPVRKGVTLHYEINE